MELQNPATIRSQNEVIVNNISKIASQMITHRCPSS